MGWFLAAIVVVLVVYLAVINRQFRYFLLIVIAGIAAYGYYANILSENRKELARKLIKPTEIEIQEAELSVGPFGRLTARVRNRSRYTLTNLSLRVIVRDCEPDGKQCITVGESNASQYLTIPPGQTRAMNASVYFSDLPKLRKWHWDFHIKEIEGQH